MKITGEQRNAASLYWTQILTGEVVPKALKASKEGLPPIMGFLESTNRKIALGQLQKTNPMWPMTFMSNLDSLLVDADDTFCLKLEYHPVDLLKKAAEMTGIPDTLFPSGKLSMTFDNKGNIIVGGEIINAHSCIEESSDIPVDSLKVKAEQNTTLIDADINALKKQQYLTEVKRHIQIIKLKADYFGTYRGAAYNEANAAANSIAQKVEDLANNYSLDKLTLDEFKTQAKNVLASDTSEMKVLETHRGCKQIMVNLLAAIILNVFYCLGALASGRLMLFKPETDAETKAHELEKAIDHDGVLKVW